MDAYRSVAASIVLLVAGAGCTVGQAAPARERRTILEEHSTTQAPGSAGTEWEAPPPGSPVETGDRPRTSQ
jgi:hypothetical protein